MTSLRRRRLLKAACAGLCMPAASFADMRGKPLIRILLGLPPGGGTDAIARYFSDALSSLLEQPVIIENRVGVGGRLAADALKSAAPDGLTYMIAPNATPTFQTLVFGNQLKWDIWRDFEPVAGLVSFPCGMAAGAATRAGNARDFARWAKANPGQATFGTPGLGGQNHFLGLQFAKAAGIDLAVAPYKGTPPMITDLLGGHIASAVTLLEDLRRYHQAGRIQLLGIFSEKRSVLAPEMPTMAEQGIDVTHGDGWTAMWAPARTPVREIARMQQALRTILSTPRSRDFLMKDLAVVPDYLDDQQMARRQRAELETWAPIIKASGFRAEL
ncbi:ABC transporter substrate-binding protein [Cupriavidus sp. USMAA2-4]|uniref:ABC transporter substrate-binding protein n=1 Tax=Cupriavidus malaysiensis TaxID=367825 RepID=A0ABM7D7S5_9BURK|nr:MULTISPECIES: tripartite tricarboxylate transporter substrate-binding protein [Cupriavidus]AOY96304.1 ABC transporter substrate-binding protein [Cupriavidus sp. USMAA2-4]AOZ03294.1 ABC transporter substrate-binding protein [Cupriavidus sp. USMAHM13]AOZ09344.1 ABC transporter substrate-binding protein [Cupriavidus malaysiensis]